MTQKGRAPSTQDWILLATFVFGALALLLVLVASLGRAAW